MPDKKRLIIVDDDSGIRDVFLMIFERYGYAVTFFQDGRPLLGHEFELPDLFILDKQLSGVDGLDVCKHLKQQERSKHIPIIMLSATPAVAKLARAAGADHFMEKPFGMHELVHLVHDLVNDGPEKFKKSEYR
jgi:DNA-binding response OmpR family regulator